MKKFLYWITFLTLLLITPSLSWAVIPMPARIYGTVTVDDESITADNDDGYTVVVTKADGTAYDPAAEDTDGFSPGYSLNIPKYDETDQPGGATTGETAKIHLYYGDTELTIDSPTDGQITVDDDASVIEHNLVAYSQKTLTIQDPDNGSITASPSSEDNTYTYGTEVTLTAEPDIYYVFESWTGEVTSASPTTTIVMDKDQTVTASFSQCSNTLTMAVSDAQMGSVIPAAGDYERACDSEVTISATAADDYYFSGWTGDVEDSTSDSTTVIMDGDKTVTANFVSTSYTLTMGSVDNGTTDPVSGDHEYGEGAVVTITATPNSGYVFSSWTGDVANSSSRTTTVTMDTDQQITANFTAAPDDTDDDSGGGGGGGGGGIFGEISIRDVLGYHFDGINSDGVRVYMPVTDAYKALKGAQTHVEGFAPKIASFIRSGFDSLEQKAESNKDGFLYRVGTYSFPVLGKIAEYYLGIVGAERLKVDAYADTTISVEEYKILEHQGKAVAPHRVNFENETEKVPVHK